MVPQPIVRPAELPGKRSSDRREVIGCWFRCRATYFSVQLLSLVCCIMQMMTLEDTRSLFETIEWSEMCDLLLSPA